MTDIVEQAARVLLGVSSWHPSAAVLRTGVARESAQALADAGLLRDPARTVPTRDEIAETLYQATDDGANRTHEYADAILALLAWQPTIDEAKAQALEEFAAHIENTAQRDDVRLTEHAVNEAGGAYLAREQAHEIKDRK